MKKPFRLFLVILILLFSFCYVISCFSQDVLQISDTEWAYMVDTSAFDGVSRAAIVIGVSNAPYISTPILAINKTDGEDLQVYLVYFPAAMCGVTTLYIKFDGEKTIYKLLAIYQVNLNRYSVKFSDSLIVEQFLTNLRTHKEVYMRLTSECLKVDATFTLNGVNNALKILEK